MSNFIGGGIIFPVELDVKGFPILRGGTTLINSSIKMILSWPVRQRIFLDQFGSQVFKTIGEPNDELLKGLVEHYIFDCLTLWEKRIQVSEVDVERIESDRLDVSVKYKLKTTGLEQTLTFPFYKTLPY